MERGAGMVAIPLLRRIDHLVSCQKSWSKFVGTDILSPFINNGTLSGNLKANLTDFFSFSGPSTVEGAVKPMELQRLRPAILTAAGYFGISTVTKEADSIFNGIVKGSNVTLDADLREAVYTTVAKANKKANLKHMIELLGASTTSDETDRLIRAIAIFDQDGVLELSLSEKVKAQDVNLLLEAYARNGGDPAVVRLLNFLGKKMLELYEKLGADSGASRKIMRVIERAAPHARDQHCIDRIEELRGEFPAILEDPRAISRSIEAIRVNMHWIATSNVATCSFLL